MICTLQVNYDLPLEAAIKAGNYDWIEDNNINDKHFQSKRSGLAEVSIKLVHINKRMSSDDILKELDKMGLRPAELPELLAFGAEYPDEQLKYPIIALGSIWYTWQGCYCVPCLDRCGVKRGLESRFAYRWNEYNRFLAVAK